MVQTGRVVQGLILFSTLLGVVFLLQVYSRLTPIGFDIVAVGWLLFVLDSFLTFVRPTAAYYLAFVLSLAALAETLSQPAHYSIVLGGDLLAASTIVVGSAAQILLLVFVPYHFRSERRKREWVWPGAKSQA